jgi:hypothetical protein
VPIQSAAGIALPSTGKVWPVPLYSQDASEWCWLACAQMLGDTPPRGLQLRQCELAQTYIPGATGCCQTKPVPAVCNHGGSVATIQQVYTENSLGFVATPVDGKPDEAQLVAWLEMGPVEVFWVTPDQAHVALIVGVQAVGPAYRYTVNDPWPSGSGQVRPLTYDQLLPTIPSGYDWDWQCVWHC